MLLLRWVIGFHEIILRSPFNVLRARFLRFTTCQVSNPSVILVPAIERRYRHSRGYGSPFFLEFCLSLLAKYIYANITGPLRQHGNAYIIRVICEWRFENREALPLSAYVWPLLWLLLLAWGAMPSSFLPMHFLVLPLASIPFQACTCSQRAIFSYFILLSSGIFRIQRFKILLSFEYYCN